MTENPLTIGDIADRRGLDFLEGEKVVGVEWLASDNDYDSVRLTFDSGLSFDATVTNVSSRERQEVGHAHISLYTEEAYGDPFIVPTAESLGSEDLGDLVYDRIVANGRATLPDPDDRPPKGETMPLGEVWWDDRGIPTRFEPDDSGEVVTFTETGGIDEIFENDD